jgi:hypothetical protein
MLTLALLLPSIAHSQDFSGHWLSDGGYRFHMELNGTGMSMIADELIRHRDYADMYPGETLAEGKLLDGKFTGQQLIFNHVKTQRICARPPKEMMGSIEIAVNQKNGTMSGTQSFMDRTGVGCDTKLLVEKFSAKRIRE